MNTHDDKDADPRRSEFMRQLMARSDRMREAGFSQIAAGKNGEKALEEWQANGVYIRHMPDDSQGILRISIGGGDSTPVSLNYCTFRGRKQDCVALLKKALAALEVLGGE